MNATQGRGGPAGLKPIEIVIGLMVVAVAVAIVGIAAWRSGAVDRLTRERRAAVAWFHSVGALKEQEQVVFRGYPMGEITRISFDNDRRLIRVDMAIDPSFRLPSRAVALVTVSSMSALSAYIEITTDFSGLDSAALVRGDLRVVERDGVIEFDAVDPVNAIALLTQGSSYIARADAQMSQFFDDANANIASWHAELATPALRTSTHDGTAQARAATAEAAGMIDRAEAAIHRGAAATESADRWLAEREDTLTAAIANAEASTARARAWMEGFAANPALAPQ